MASTRTGNPKKTGTAKKSPAKNDGAAKKTAAKKTAAKKTAAGKDGAKKSTSRYGAKAQEMVAEELHELKRGRLRSSTGATVKTREQAIAIGLSEARRAGGKVPKKKP